jgi:hypothetical protein
MSKDLKNTEKTTELLITDSSGTAAATAAATNTNTPASQKEYELQTQLDFFKRHLMQTTVSSPHQTYEDLFYEKVCSYLPLLYSQQQREPRKMAINVKWYNSIKKETDNEVLVVPDGTTIPQFMELLKQNSYQYKSRNKPNTEWQLYITEGKSVYCRVLPNFQFTKFMNLSKLDDFEIIIIPSDKVDEYQKYRMEQQQQKNKCPYDSYLPDHHHTDDTHSNDQPTD